MSKDGTNVSDQCILEEIEALKAIFFSELDVSYSPTGRPIELQTTLYPSTADDTNQHYVCVSLIMKFPCSYPEQPPSLELRNPRGLGEEFLTNVLSMCNEKCSNFSGSPVIYEIIELVRESLTNSNKPIGHCTICLFGFHDEDVFTYTQCYHHFHSHCLARYCRSLQSQWAEEDRQEMSNNPSAACWKEKKEKQFSCPVCRKDIDITLDVLEQAPPPCEGEASMEEFQKDPKLLAWRKQMKEEYQKQKRNGGIIDQLAEDNRFLVVTETTNGPNVSNVAVESTPTQLEGERVVEASANNHCHSEDQSKYGRGGGKYFRRPDSRGNKFRAGSVQNVPNPSGSNTRENRSVPHGMGEAQQQQQHQRPQQRQQQPLPSNQRSRGSNSSRSVVSNGQQQPTRPPPGFPPR